MYPLHLEKQVERTFIAAFRSRAEPLIRQIIAAARDHLRPVLSVSGDMVVRADGIGDLIRFMEDLERQNPGGISQEELESAIRANYRMIEAAAKAETDKAWRQVQKDRGREIAKTETPLRSSNPEADEFLKERARAGMQMLEDLTGEHRRQVFDIVYESVRNGDTLKTITEKIKEATGASESRAAFWAQDQVGDVHAQLTRIRQKEAGFAGYVWRTMKDARVRDSHIENHGKYFDWSIGATNLEKPGARHPGEDWRCVPASARILFSHGVARCYRHWYSGELSVVSTDSGKTISATPNHPVLTDAGWKPIHLLKTGDYVIEIADQGVNIPEEDEEQREVRASDVFDLARLRFPLERTRGFASQFHGDGTTEEVYVIATERGLMNKRNLSASEVFRHLRLSITDQMIILSLKASYGAFPFQFFRRWLAAYGIVSGLCQFLSFFWRCFAHPHIHRFGPVAWLNAHRKKSLSDCATVDAEPFGAFLFADSREVETRKSRVVDVASKPFHGFTYNFETDSGYYYSDGVSMHNCRCYAAPAMVPPAIGKQEEENDRATTAREEDRRKIQAIIEEQARRLRLPKPDEAPLLPRQVRQVGKRERSTLQFDRIVHEAPPELSDLSTEEAMTIHRWTSPYYYNAVNRSLRTGHGTSWTTAFSEQLNLALENLPDYRGTVYRRLDASFDPLYRSIVETGRLTDTGFTAATKNKHLSLYDWKKRPDRYMMIIESTTGKDISRLSWINQRTGVNLEEVLFRKGSELELVRIDESSNPIRIWMREASMERNDSEGIDMRGMTREERKAVFDRIERRRRRGEIPVSEEWKGAQKKLSDMEIYMLKRFQ